MDSIKQLKHTIHIKKKGKKDEKTNSKHKRKCNKRN